MENYKEKIESDPVVQLLLEMFKDKHPSLQLTGGAISDILNDRKPRDYDFLGTGLNDKLTDWEFTGETKTAKTYTKDGIIIQLLKTKSSEFDFTISQATYNFNNSVVTIDEESFKSKVLKPVNFTTPERALGTLRRAKHWEAKGYKLPNSTYQSLLDVVAAKINVKEEYSGGRS